MTLTFLPLPEDEAVTLSRQVAFARHALRQQRRLAATPSRYPAVKARAAERAREAEAVLATLQSLSARPRRALEP